MAEETTSWGLYYWKPQQAINIEQEDISNYIKLFSGFGKGLEFIKANVPNVKLRIGEPAEGQNYHVVFYGTPAAIGYAMTGFISCAGAPSHVTGDYAKLDDILAAFGKATKEGGIKEKMFRNRLVVDKQ